MMGRAACAAPGALHLRVTDSPAHMYGSTIGYRYGYIYGLIRSLDVLQEYPEKKYRRSAEKKNRKRKKEQRKKQKIRRRTNKK